MFNHIHEKYTGQPSVFGSVQPLDLSLMLMEDAGSTASHAFILSTKTTIGPTVTKGRK